MFEIDPALSVCTRETLIGAGDCARDCRRALPQRNGVFGQSRSAQTRVKCRPDRNSINGIRQ